MPLSANDVLNVNYTQPPPSGTIAADNGTQQIVQDGWQRSLEYASNALNTATQFINQLEQAALRLVLPTIDPHLNVIELDISALNYLLGTAPNVPANNFTFTEIPYSSNLLTDLRATLLQWVDGTATGILPSVEQAIYDRGRAREAAVSNRKAQEAVRQFAMRGFPKPPGMLSLEIQDAVQEAQNASITLDRDVIIKQAELEQSNRRFSMEQAWKVEEGAITYTTQQMQRALEKARAFQQFTNEIFQQQVAEYGVETQAYASRVGAETQAFRAKVDMQVAEANVRMEAARVELQGYIEGLRMQMEAVKAGAQVSAQLAASALASINLSGQLADHTSNSASYNASNSVSNNVGFSVGASAQYSYSGSV